jgi:hypothetical protein
MRYAQSASIQFQGYTPPARPTNFRQYRVCDQATDIVAHKAYSRP